MTILSDRVVPTSDTYRANRAFMEISLRRHDEQLAIVNGGGGPKYVERHRQRDKLLARERVEALLDLESPFLELSPLAAWGTDFPVGAGLVTGIGVIEGTECLIMANDPTVRGGHHEPDDDAQVAARLPGCAREPASCHQPRRVGGADLPTQSEIFIPGGQAFHDITQLSAEGIPTSRSCSATPPPAVRTCQG
jgi:acetyl-CoA carboxylase carboxyltransferase component